MQTDEFYMHKALELAKLAEGCTSPNPMVGCVITDAEGNIVGEGYHHKAGEAHAEVNALADVHKHKATPHTAYVSLEPCSHFGRTGPCCDALLRAGIKRVVAAIEDPNPKVSGQGFARLKAGGVDLKIGVCAEEARKLNEQFLLWVTKRRPFISLKYAMTLDGKIATAGGDGTHVTGGEAHIFSHYLRKTNDAILVGINTVLADDPELTTRLVKGKNPIRIILDSKLRIPLTAQVLQGGAPTIVVTGPDADATKVQMLSDLPDVEVLTVPVQDGKLNLVELMKILGERKIISVLVEGGSAVLGSFVDAKLADRVYAFIAPKIVGGKAGLTPIGGTGLASMVPGFAVDVDLQKNLGPDFLISGTIKCAED